VTDAFRDELSGALGGGYTIDRELAGGGMSRVFVATEHALNRTVVVKVLKPDLAADVNRERFRREIMLAAQLHHPHIVPVLNAGQSAELLWYTMPFVEGESLRETLRRGRTMSGREVTRVLHDVLDALDYAHTRGVVHRDIKPGNILRHRSHSLVTDFGVAKALSAAMPHSGTTSAGMAIGTPAYMAPEQIAADPKGDHRMDLYAVGLLAYELLTGTQPFSASSPQETLAAQLTRMPPALDTIRDDLPPLLVSLVTQLLAKNPDDRPPTAASALAELEAITTSSDTTPARTWTGTGRSMARTTRGRAAIAMAGVLVAVAVVFGIFHGSDVSAPAATPRPAGDTARSVPATTTADSATAPARQPTTRPPTTATTTKGTAPTTKVIGRPAPPASTPPRPTPPRTTKTTTASRAPTARFATPRKVAVLPARYQPNRADLAPVARALTDSVRHAAIAAGYTLASDAELVQLLAQPGGSSNRAAADAAGIGAVITTDLSVRASEVRAQSLVHDIWRNMHLSANESADVDKPNEVLGVVRDVARGLDRVSWRRREEPRRVLIFEVDNVTGMDSLGPLARRITEEARSMVARELGVVVIQDSIALATKDVMERREVGVRTGAGALVALSLQRARRDSVSLRFSVRDLSEEHTFPTVEARMPITGAIERARAALAQMVDTLRRVNWGPKASR
jgi:serine/threonine protein kinase